VPHLAAALLILLFALPAGAHAQAGVSYQIPPDNPFAGQAGVAPEIYSFGLRNPFRFSFDRESGDVFVGDVGQTAREEVSWATRAEARGGNFGWACREGSIDGPKAANPSECPVANPIEPLFDYSDSGSSDDREAVTGGFVVRDPSLTGLVGRYLYADFFAGVIRSLARDRAAPDDQSTGLTVPNLASFGEDASGRVYVASLAGEVARLTAGPSSGTLDMQPLTGPFSAPISVAAFPGDASRLFVAERGGTVRLVVDDVVRPEPFLDVAPFGIGLSGERGLLSVTAAPDYARSGKVYVFYTEPGGDIRVEEFTRSLADPEVADPASRRNLLTIEHSASHNHNGGQLHFDAERCLWIATGDGGGANDSFNNAQNPRSLLGKLLRINPDPPDVAGPACGSAPLPRPAAGTGRVADLTPPLLATRVRPWQRALRLRAAIAYVRCSEACDVSVGGTLRIGRHRLLQRRAVASAAENRRLRLRVPLRRRGARLLRSALARGGLPRFTLRIRAHDSAGNAAPTVVRTLRVMP
jgi:glucose/arabinose dehydrogenase